MSDFEKIKQAHMRKLNERPYEPNYHIKNNLKSVHVDALTLKRDMLNKKINHTETLEHTLSLISTLAITLNEIIERGDELD